MFGFFRSNSPDFTYDPGQAVSDLKADRISVIDIREPSEVKTTGKAEGALHVPLAALRMKADPASPEQLEEFRSGKPVVLYCASGSRSQIAVRMLRHMGLEEVYNLGGLAHWEMAGGVIGR
ncbi:rhodanese-like domain-containing protein [Nioella aestuarii]|uniref:rhodanese-like domain-containing protein n=1 Tax=Nioella aestuarii TaxID=1662864 RepID=UPI003D7F5EE6